MLPSFPRFLWLLPTVGLFLLNACWFSNGWLQGWAGLFMIFFPYLFLLVLFTAIIQWFWQKKGPWLSIVVLLLSLPMMHRHFPWLNYFGSKPTIDNNAIKLMSWNVEDMGCRHNYVYDTSIRNQIVQLVQQEKPAIFCALEFVAGSSSRSFVQIDSITKALGYRYVYYDHVPGTDFDSLHHFGKAIFTNYPVLQNKIISFNSGIGGDRISLVDVQTAATALRILLVHLESLKTSFAVYPHLADSTFERLFKSKRSDNQLQRMLTAFREHEKQANIIQSIVDTSSIPVVVCGDFNDVPNSYACKLLNQKMNNAHETAGKGWGTSFSRILPWLRIDHVFVSQSLQVLSANTNNHTNLSDHFPISVNVNIKK
jgi:endonuclease/exonuclease/phosphatase family metal-dependent hydrolase